ncbi:Myc-type basic helix-loop-helix (bHLH) domain [Trinorchestia longiramus]|nr:Myc-type basic helix-loop-helix (bHLH) domain [Trinorchestia longiramus]
MEFFNSKHNFLFHFFSQQYPKRRSSYSGAPHGNGNRKSPISQSSSPTVQVANSLQHVTSPSRQHQLSSPHGQYLPPGGGSDIHLGRSLTVSTAASISPVSSAAGWNVLSTESISRNPRLIAPATLSQPLFTAFVTKGEPGEPSSNSGQLQDGANNGNNHVLLSGGTANAPNSAPVKLSFVIPNVSPPALIPLTTVTPLTTADALASKTLQSGTRTISLAPVPQATFAASNSFNQLPFLPVSSSNSHTPRSTSLTTLTPLPGGGTTFFAAPLTFTTSASGVAVVPASNTVTSRTSNPRSQISVTLPNVTLSAVTPSSLKSIPHTQQVLFSSVGGVGGNNVSSGGSNNQFSAPHIFKTSPPYLGPSSPLPSPPNKAFRPKNDQERVQYREHRRVCHINAEKKRRCSIKSNFEMLHSLIPSITNTPNSKISKAALLHKGADYIQQLKNDRQQLTEKIDLAKQELENLSAQISTAQSQLPATGAPMSHSRHNQLGQMYKEYVRERTLNHSWKFYIFSLLGETLLQSFNANVSTASVEDLSRSSLAWLDQHCSLNLLRPVVSSKMLQLSQQTSVLSNPQLLSEEIYHLVTKQEDKHNSNSGSSSNSSRSSSLVRICNSQDESVMLRAASLARWSLVLRCRHDRLGRCTVQTGAQRQYKPSANINRTWGEESTRDRTVRRWFGKFRSGDESLNDEEGRGSLGSLENEQLHEQNPRQSVREISQTLRVSIATVSSHLKIIGKVKKLDKWVPHELNENQKLRRFDVCSMLSLRNTNDPFLDRIVTCDEKWVLYDNRKRSGQWLDRDEPPQTLPKANVAPEKDDGDCLVVCTRCYSLQFLGSR